MLLLLLEPVGKAASSKTAHIFGNTFALNPPQRQVSGCGALTVIKLKKKRFSSILVPDLLSYCRTTSDEASVTSIKQSELK